MITIKDVAKACDVSIATVSKIINGRDEHISEETRKRVKTVIEEQGYIHNSIARGLKLRKTYTLGFILPDITNPYFACIARGIEDSARKWNYSVITCNTDGKDEIEMKSLELFESKMVDGIVISRLLADMENQATREKYSTLFRHIPTVIMDRQAYSITSQLCGHVFIDALNAFKSGTKMLYEAGCRRIAYVSAIENISYDRFTGYCEALKELGIPFNPDLVYRKGYTYSIDLGREAIEFLLKKKLEFDAVICGNDLVAIGTINTLKDRGFQIPGDIKILGMDDIQFAEYVVPRLSTMAQPIYEMGWTAADMLIDRIENGTKLYSKVFKTRFVERDTFQMKH